MANERVHFKAAMEGMKEQLVRMGAKGEHAIDLAVQSYLTRDQILCSEVLSLEREMNQCERHIDEIAIQLLAHAQQEEIDLRLITACLKINTNLERIGDLSVSIAELSLSDYRPRIDLPVDILKVSAAVANMIRKALRAFVDTDGDLAEAVIRMSDVLDRMNNDAWIRLVAEMHESSHVIDQALAALMVVRNLELVSDHATNLAEDVMFWIQGSDARHRIGRLVSIEG